MGFIPYPEELSSPSMVSDSDVSDRLPAFLRHFRDASPGGNRRSSLHTPARTWRACLPKIVNGVFQRHDDAAATLPAPVVRFHSHWTGTVLRLRGVLLTRPDGRSTSTFWSNAERASEPAHAHHVSVGSTRDFALASESASPATLINSFWACLNRAMGSR